MKTQPHTEYCYTTARHCPHNRSLIFEDRNYKCLTGMNFFTLPSWLKIYLFPFEHARMIYRLSPRARRSTAEDINIEEAAGRKVAGADNESPTAAAQGLPATFDLLQSRPPALTASPTISFLERQRRTDELDSHIYYLAQSCPQRPGNIAQLFLKEHAFLSNALMAVGRELYGELYDFAISRLSI